MRNAKPAVFALSRIARPIAATSALPPMASSHGARPWAIRRTLIRARITRIGRRRALREPKDAIVIRALRRPSKVLRLASIQIELGPVSKPTPFDRDATRVSSEATRTTGEATRVALGIRRFRARVEFFRRCVQPFESRSESFRCWNSTASRSKRGLIVESSGSNAKAKDRFWTTWPKFRLNGE